eukprot:Sspe_Gene.86370::Locus_57043_Transcript_2_3_Confidence_0.750_Length_417::g.86370::m.86370
MEDLPATLQTLSKAATKRETLLLKQVSESRKREKDLHDLIKRLEGRIEDLHKQVAQQAVSMQGSFDGLSDRLADFPATHTQASRTTPPAAPILTRPTKAPRTPLTPFTRTSWSSL